jgi:hypothetical protein
MWPIQTDISTAELLRENDHVAMVCLGDQGDALNAFEVLCPGKCDAHSVPRVCAVGKKIFALHGVYAEVLDSELLIFPKNVVCCRYEEGFWADRERKTVCAFSHADYRATVGSVRPEKHYIPVIVFNNPGIVDSDYRIGHVIPGKDGIPVISLYKRRLSIHTIQPCHYRCSIFVGLAVKVIFMCFFMHLCVNVYIFFDHPVDGEAVFDRLTTV